MGPFHFELPPDLTPAAQVAAASGWLVNGYDHTPVPARRTVTPTRLSLLRDETESSHLALPWPGTTGSRTITTATLRPRPEPYQLLTELARGSVNRVRTFAAELANVQVPLPRTLAAQLASVTRHYGRTALGTASSLEEQPLAVLDEAGVVSDGLVALLNEERFRTRAQRGPLNTRFGCRVSRPLSPEDAETYAATFNAIRIVPDWSCIEPSEAGFNWATLDPLVRWATDAGLKVSIGPIIDVADGAFPDWLKTWEGDVPTLTAFLTDFVATVVARYRQQCRVWQLLSGFNHADALGLGEDDRIKLAARLLETAREVDPDGEWVISLAQPWGEYLSKPGHAYSPFVLIDTLLRAGFELGGLELEFLAGPSPRCSSPRDALDLVQVMESYDSLGVPLHIKLGRPLPDPTIVGLLETCLAAPTVTSLHWDCFTTDDPSCRVPGSSLLASPETLAAFHRVNETRLK